MGARIGGVLDRMVCDSPLVRSLGEADKPAMEFDDIVLRGCVGPGFVRDLIHRAGNFAAMGDVAGCALGGDSSIDRLSLQACPLSRIKKQISTIVIQNQ